MTKRRFPLPAPAILLLLGAMVVPPAMHAEAPEGEEPELPVSRERLEQIARGYTVERVGVPTPTPPPLPEVENEAAMELRTDGPARAGEETTLTVALRGADGEPLTSAELTPFRGRMIELHLVDAGLEDYHRLVPEEADEPGEYQVTFTPMNGGEYTAFLFLRPASTKILETLRSSVAVAGTPAAWDLTEKYHAMAGAYSFELDIRGSGPRAERLLRGEIAVRNPQGAIATGELLEIGSDPMTLTAISYHRNRAFLAHFPSGIITAEEAGTAPVPFTLMLDHPGIWHLFATVELEDRTLTVPFRIHAANPRETTTNEEAFEELDRLEVALDQALLSGQFLEAADIVPLMKRQFATLTGNLGDLPERHQTALPSVLFRVTQALDLIDRFAAAEAATQYSLALRQLQVELEALRQVALVPERGDWRPATQDGQCAFGGGAAGKHDMGAHALYRNYRVDFCSFTCAARFHQAPDAHLDMLLEGRAAE